MVGINWKRLYKTSMHKFFVPAAKDNTDTTYFIGTNSTMFLLNL